MGRLSPADAATLVDVATESVRHAVVERRPWRPDVTTHSAALREPGMAFVTLRHHGQLRGCIGTLTAVEPLVWCVADRARAAALSDPRFRPVRADEVPFLDIEVSVLSAPEPFDVAGYDDLLRAVRRGADGLVVEVGRRRATLLPSVWQDLPSPEEFVGALWHKAGLPAGYWSDAVALARYTSTVAATPSAASSR